MCCSSRSTSFEGEDFKVELSGSSDLSTSTFLCTLPLCIFNPFSELKTFSHWLHLKVPEEFSNFFFKKSSFLFWFLLSLDGLGFFFFFFTTWLVSPLVSREKVKEGPRVMEMEKFCPLVASAWQNSRHWFSRTGSPLVGVILTDKSHIRKDAGLNSTSGMDQSFYLK